MRKVKIGIAPCDLCGSITDETTRVCHECEESDYEDYNEGLDLELILENGAFIENEEYWKNPTYRKGEQAWTRKEEGWYNFTSTI